MPDFLWKAAQADAQILEGRLQASSHAQAMQMAPRAVVTVTSPFFAWVI